MLKSSLSQSHLCTENTGVPGVKGTCGHDVSGDNISTSFAKHTHHNILSITCSFTKSPLHRWLTSENKPVRVCVCVFLSDTTFPSGKHLRCARMEDLLKWKIQYLYDTELNADDLLLFTQNCEYFFRNKGENPYMISTLTVF